MTEGTSTSGAPAATETTGPAVAVATAAPSAAAPAPAPAPVDADVAAMAAPVATAAPQVANAQPAAPNAGPTEVAIAAAEAAAAVAAAAAKKADSAKKDDDDSDVKSMSDAEMLAEVELASLGEAGAATAGQAGLPCGVFPVVDAPVAAAPPPVAVPVDGGGFGLSPILLGALGLGAVGLGLALLGGDDNNEEEEEEEENQGPLAADDAAAADEDETVTGDVSANDSDPEGDELTFELNEDVEGLTLNEDGTFTFDAEAAGLDNLGQGETATITAEYTVTDAEGLTDTATLTITVTGVNVAPIATDQNIAANENGEIVTGTVTGTDEDGDTLTFSATELQPGVTLNANGTFSIDPSNAAFQDLAAGETRVVVQTFTVTDENGATDTGTITFTVTGQNDAPILTVDQETDVDENIDEQTVVLDAEAIDPDGEDVTFSIGGEDAEFFDIDPLTGEVRFTESPDFEDQETFNITVTATDVSGASDTENVVININDLDDENEAPVLNVDNNVDIDENLPDDTVVVDADATDADGDEVTFRLEGEDAEFFRIDAETGEIRLRNAADFEEQDSFQITVVATDEEGNEDRENITVNVNDVDENRAPVLTVDDATPDIDENEPENTVVVDADATDADGDEITFSLEGDDAEFFNIDEDTGEVRLNESADFENRSQFDITIVATDEEGNRDERDIEVTINDVDETPDDEQTVVFLDEIDPDNNPNTENVIDATGDDFLFFDDRDEGSFTRIQGFDEGDTIQFEEGAEVSFTTVQGDPGSLEITVNNNGVVSQIILEDVIENTNVIVLDEASAEAAVGFDFFEQGPTPTDTTFA